MHENRDDAPAKLCKVTAPDLRDYSFTGRFAVQVAENKNNKKHRFSESQKTS